MRAAVLPLLERAAGKGPREAGGRNGPCRAPSARGCGARRAARKGPREAGGRNGLWCAPSARGAVRAGQPPGPCCASLMRAAVLPLLERAAGKGPREAGGRNGPCRAPSARAMVRPVGVAGRGECRAFLTPGPCCASLMRAAVLPLLERAAGKGPREAGGRNGPCRAPSARGVVRPVGAGLWCAGRHGGKARSKTGAPRGAEGLLARPFAQGPALRGEKREKRKGVCRRRLLRQTPSFSLSRSVLGMLCAGCSTALPWPVRPARRRRTPPARAPARPRPGPWPHTALPFRSS